jgi:hypothetical protein
VTGYYLTSEAIADLEEIWAFIAADSIEAADRMGTGKRNTDACGNQSKGCGGKGGFDNDSGDRTGSRQHSVDPLPETVLRQVGNEGYVMQVHRHDDLPGGEFMSDRKNAKRIASHEVFMHDACRIDQVCCQAYIKLARRDQIAHVTRRQDKQRNQSLRMFPPKYRDCFRYDRLAGRKK